MPLDENAAKKKLAELMAIAKKQAPGAEVAASLSSRRAANTRFARNEITSTGDVDETRLSVTVAFGRREASVSTNQLDAASLRAAVESAARLAKLSPEDPERMPVLGAQKHAKAKGAYDKGTAGLDAAARAKLAAAAIEAGERGDLDVSGFYEHEAGVSALATSKGLSAAYASTSAELTTTCRTADGSGSGWAGAIATRAAELDPVAAARTAAEKAARSAKPARLEPGRYTVVLEPAAVAELCGFLVSALDRRRADEGRSFFSRAGGGARIGEKLFGEHVTLWSDPTDPATPAAPFDGDGQPVGRTTWIDKGTLAALSCSRFWAAKQGLQPLPSAGAYHLAGGAAASVDALLSGVKRGVLITRFWYTRWVDPRTILITGLTRDGVFLIENGAVTRPVNNFRFNESPVQMLANADAITRATFRTPTGRTRVPALRTHDFNLASVSEAV